MGLSAGCLLHKGCGSGLGEAAPAGELWASSSFLLKHAEGFSRSALFCGKCRAFESQLFSWVAANKLSQIRMWFQGWSLCIEHLPARLPGLCHLPPLQLRDIYTQTSRKHISLGVCQRELGLEPTPHVTVCPPQYSCSHTALSLLRGLGWRAHPPSPQPMGPDKHSHWVWVFLPWKCWGSQLCPPPSFIPLSWLWARTSWEKSQDPLALLWGLSTSMSPGATWDNESSHPAQFFSLHPKWAEIKLYQSAPLLSSVELMTLSLYTSPQTLFFPPLHAAPWTQNCSFYAVPFAQYLSSHPGWFTLIAQSIFYTFMHEALVTAGWKYIKFKSNAIPV